MTILQLQSTKWDGINENVDKQYPTYLMGLQVHIKFEMKKGRRFVYQL